MNQFPVDYLVDLGASDGRGDLLSLLAEQGIALVDRISAARLLPLVSSLGVVVPHRDSDVNGITALEDRGVAFGNGLLGFTSCALEPHTDSSGLLQPPELVFLVCGRAAASGGECILVDGLAIHDDLAISAPDALKALSEPRCVFFGGANGHLGSVFAPYGDNQITIRFRSDELARFGPAASRALPEFRAAIRRHMKVINLHPGQGYVLCNHRWLHGRRAFVGRRIMFRIHANTSPHLRIPGGFKPSTRPISI